MTSYSFSKGNSSSCPCPKGRRLEDATLDDVAAVVAGLNDKVLLLRNDILDLKNLDTRIHSGSTSPMGPAPSTSREYRGDVNINKRNKLRIYSSHHEREILPSLRIRERTLTEASRKKGKRIQEAGDSVHSDESSLKSFNAEYTKSTARNFMEPERSNVIKFKKSQRHTYGKYNRRDKLSNDSVNDIYEQQAFFPASEIDVPVSAKVRFSARDKEVKKKPSRIKEFIRKGKVSKSKFQKEEMPRDRGNRAALILNEFQDRNKLTVTQSSRSPEMLLKCQSIQKSLNLTNSVYCDCEMAPPVIRKVIRKRISRGVQYEDPKKSNRQKRTCLNCFKSCKCTKKHRKKRSKSKKQRTSVDRDSVEVILRPEHKVLRLSERENSNVKHLSSPFDQRDVRNGRHKLNRSEIHGFDIPSVNITSRESPKGIKYSERISDSSNEFSKQPKKASDREPGSKYKDKSAERQFIRYFQDSRALNEAQVDKLKHVRKNNPRLKNNDQFISDSDSGKIIDTLNNGNYTANKVSSEKSINKRPQRMSGGGEDEYYESLKYFETQRKSAIGIDDMKNQSKNLSHWFRTKTIFKKITGRLFASQSPQAHDQTEETRISRNNKSDTINVNDIKKRLDSCLFDLNNIMADVSFMCKEKQIARSFAYEPK